MAVGENKRYPGHSMERAIEESVTRPRPIGLTAQELELDTHPVTTPDSPIPARAWVRFTEAVIQPECLVVAWTDHAVKIRWTTFRDEELEVWVYKGAVVPRLARPQSH